MTVYATTNFGGPLASINNKTGINVIPVSLVNQTALTWTHNFNATPILILCSVNNNTNGGLLCPPSGTNGIAVTSTNNTIVLTPVASLTALVIVIWTLPTGSQNGQPIPTFV